MFLLAVSCQTLERLMLCNIADAGGSAFAWIRDLLQAGFLVLQSIQLAKRHAASVALQRHESITDAAVRAI